MLFLRKFVSQLYTDVSTEVLNNFYYFLKMSLIYSIKIYQIIILSDGNYDGKIEKSIKLCDSNNPKL